MYRAEKPGAALAELLPGMLDSALAALPIERRMRWGAHREEFVRPVHWIGSLSGPGQRPITLCGRDSGGTTRGHRFMGESQINISSADDYVEACLTGRVMVDFDKRRQLIRSEITSIAEEEQAELEIDEDLLDEVTSLVEWPVALKGDFEEAFLEVPPEVLISAMKEHQRYFHLTDGVTGQLRPAFITISNIESSDPEVVVKGNERVIRPRLSDAAFFYSQDTRTSLESKTERLDSVVFQTDLGTYGDKARRISRLAAHIAGNLDTDPDAAARAGLLAKADLISDMVGEFPDLQGIMGAYYAKHDGEPDDVVKGIEQHYRPTQSGGDLPEGLIASSIALADKIDTLTGIFGINQPPTGSRDPFALRRQSLGVIRICIENGLPLSMEDCFKASADLYDASFDTAEVLAYVMERLNGYYSEQGIGRDVVDAAAAGDTAGTNLLTIDRVIRALQSFRSSPLANQIIAANKRVANILRKTDVANLPGFNPELATDDAEMNLHNALAQLDLADSAEVDARLETLAALQQPVDTFFDEVLVMEDDEQTRNNRLALLFQLRQQFLEVADFSLLQ